MSTDDLRLWWEAEFEMVAGVGCDAERAAEAMFTVAAKRWAETLGPRRLALEAQKLACMLWAAANAIDDATVKAAQRPRGTVQ